MAVSCNSEIYDSRGGEYYEKPYEEISHEIDNNFMSIKVPKNIGQIEAVQESTTPLNSIRVNCAHENICREECTKVNIIPNRKPPAKKPEEELFLLRCKKRVLQTDTVEHTLEIELKAPRNYRPLPKPGPPPPIIEIPSLSTGKNGKSKKIKKKKKK
ncbi:uncharacterized protein LOC127284588 [Leptopilina boulardi]|uniref:uncharacterized protein LOC127284588 n=1 Tax=Leptopilina boulardi TaxID=63433 RepID=UPI0021F6894D|nr:uncharacterized protein LOC127284588 [Leptopilina boulardi]